MYRKLLALTAAVGALILAPLSTGAAVAEKRVALVIGNAAYQNVAELPHPIKDATAVADMFQKAGFDWVKMRQDVGNLEFKRALREFMDAAQDADIAVVYYAGHGIQVRDMNFMIPVDARLGTEVDAEDEAVSLDRIVMAIEPAKRLRLVILDACRDNPFARTMKRRVATRAISGGLARMEPAVGDTLIAYAAKAGSTAEDGEGAHSPFAAALIKNLAVPGLDIRLAFGRVRDEVLKRTSNKQEPFVYGSVGGVEISLVPAAAQRKVEALSEVKGEYEIAERVGTKKAWEVFLASHKEGIYAELARAQLTKLNEAEGKAADAASPQGLALATLEPATPAKPRGPSSEGQGAWDQIKASGDRAKLRDFIAKYPASPLAETAQNRLNGLERAAEEREDKDEKATRLRAEEAARKSAERETARVPREEANARHRDETARDREDAKRKELRREREQARREESRREREQAQREESRREREQAKREESRREREQAKREESRRETARRKTERAQAERTAPRSQSAERTQASSELPPRHFGVGGILGIGGVLGRSFLGR